VSSHLIASFQAAGIGIPCLSSELLEKNNAEGGDPEAEQTIKRVAAGTFVGGQINPTLRICLD
jgi:hypothetical protein